jgi:hypothetical protein
MNLNDRLDALTAKGTIAGWKPGGGPNYGLNPAPLPTLIFPANGGGASTYYNDLDLGVAVQALETFGAIHHVGDSASEDCPTCFRYHPGPR